MKKLRLLKDILVRTKAHHILYVYICFVLVSALVITLVDPNINKYTDALWYLYAVISTAGFGDIVVVSLVAKIASVLVTIYSILVIAIVTGVVVNFYTEVTQIQKKETLTAFVDKLENLESMSKDELKEISAQVKNFRKNFK